MDFSIPDKRRKKKDKAKEKHDRNGSFSQKHVRAVEATQEKNATKATKSTSPKKK